MRRLRGTVLLSWRSGRAIQPLFRRAVAPAIPAIGLPRPGTTGSQHDACRWLGMTEPAVTITDYLLTVETSLFALHTAHRPTNQPGLRSWLMVFFGSIAVASFAGGTVHGFFPRAGSKGNRLLWSVTYAAIGVTSLAAWLIGVKIACPARIARFVTGMATVAVAIYLIVALFISRQFIVAIVAYIPATSFLLGALLLRYRRTRDRAMLAPVAGVVLTFVAATVQAARLTIHPHLFDHNVLYHLIQAAALALLFAGVGSLLDRDRSRRAAVVLVPVVAR